MENPGARGCGLYGGAAFVNSGRHPSIICTGLAILAIVALQPATANEISIKETGTYAGLLLAAEKFQDSVAGLMLDAFSDDPGGPNTQCLTGMFQEIDHFVKTLDIAVTLMALSARMVNKADEKVLLTTLQPRLNDVFSDADPTRDGARKYVSALCPTNANAAAKLEEFNRLIYAAVDMLRPVRMRAESAVRAR